MSGWRPGRFGDRDHESVVRGVVSRTGCSYSDTLKFAVLRFDWLVKLPLHLHNALGDNPAAKEKSLTITRLGYFELGPVSAVSFSIIARHIVHVWPYLFDEHELSWSVPIR